jgi:hypothetical protein
MTLKLNADRVLSLSALVVGIGSLFVVVYQTKLTREAQYASARPYLYIALMSNDEGAALLLHNVGIGPALIDEVRVRDKGRTFVGDPFDFYKASHPDQHPSVDKVLPGRLIPAGATIQMLGGSDAQMGTELLRMFDVAEVPRSWYDKIGVSPSGKAVVDITFSSVYGDRWRISSDTLVPEEL